MVQEAVAAEVEQPVETEAEQPEEVAEQAEESVAVTEAEAVAEAVPEVATDDQPDDSEPVLDLSTDDGIRAAAESNVQLRSFLEKTRKDAEHDGKQRREAELRREAADNARTQAVLQGYADGLQKNPQQVQSLAAQAIQQNRQFALGEAAAEITNTLLGYEVPNDTLREAQAELNTSSLPDRVDRYVKTLMSAVVDTEVGKAMSDQDSKIEKLVKERVEAEIKARNLESAPKPSTPPATPPAGIAAGGKNPTPEEYAKATTAQRAKWKREGVEIAFSE